MSALGAAHARQLLAEARAAEPADQARLLEAIAVAVVSIADDLSRRPR